METTQDKRRILIIDDEAGFTRMVKLNLEKAGPYDKATAKSFYDNVLSVGNTLDPAVGYKKFRGRDASYEALMRQRGFPLPTKP